jgi:ribosomal protein L32
MAVPKKKRSPERVKFNLRVLRSKLSIRFRAKFNTNQNKTYRFY